MKSPFEAQIRKKANEVIAIFKKNNFESEISENHWEEYCVTMKIWQDEIFIGSMKIYYSPNKKSFKYVFKINNDENIEKIKNILSVDKQKIYKNKGYEIDVDGSYQNGLTGYGAIIRKDGKVIKELCGIVKEIDVDGSRQVAGELKAATETINWCEKNLVDEITIYYDYDGVRKWAKGEWKSKKPVAKEYAEFMKTIKIKIHWVKIKSHTGAYWNEEADRLASRAINN